MQLGLWIWVDALCINQDDPQERAREVPRMRIIYKSALDVVIWLGEGRDNSDLAIRLIKTLSKFSEENNALSVGRMLSKDPNFLGVGAWRALGQLMNREYWSRVWIMQEIALGNAQSPLLCGQEAATWDDFVRALNTFTAHHLKLVFTLVESQYSSAELAGTIYSGLNRGRIIHFRTAQNTELLHGPETSDNLMPLLDLGRRALATDNRDKVYGILGLMPTAIREVVKVDYQLPVAEVYASFARAIFETVRNLAILEQCSGPAIGMPSWAQDWTEKDHYRLFGGNCNYHAGIESMDVSFTAHFSEDGNVLRCRVAYIDTIEGLGVRFVYPFGTKSNESWEDSIVQPRTCSNAYQTENGLHDALWRTLVGNRTPNGKKAPLSYSSLLKCPILLGEEVSEELRSWRGRKAFDQVVGQNAALLIAGRSLASFFPTENDPILALDPAESHDAMERMFRLHRSRRLAVTSRGYLGLVPAASRQDDCIGILERCPVAMTLRRVSSHEFEVIGPAYLHGFMESGDRFKEDVGDCWQINLR
ncbi:hypothetical protein N0V93_008787 [Gnomoniopsis smithogilvyi]|uniref:Heterokaryon incompatibility domain-containing protein n=1 Tax=Gnomoniopsis smithogilvyi TaxID=1191159 RepID=A0A9W8YQN9_9PEZI|nr:hypothetical protein N0V93_008787 [Gnomoniopsis smithogilvyi]